MAVSDHRSRLVELAAERRVSLAGLSAMIGRNPSYLQQFVRKGSPRKLEEGDRRALARFFGVSEAELGRPEGISFDPAEKPASPWVEVPRLPLRASAGPGALALDEQPVGAFCFSARWLRERGLEGSMLSAIVVEGDSMEPTLRDGDEILVDRSPRPIRDGIHVIRNGEALLVKRVDTGRRGVIVLRSDNPAYAPVEVAPADVQLVGRVVWKGGRL